MTTHSMEWLMEYAARKRRQVCEGPFFRALPNMDRSLLQWFLPSLLFFSRRYIQALMTRAGKAPWNSRYVQSFTSHAVSEGEHPDQLRLWMHKHGFNPGRDPTNPTLLLANLCQWSADFEAEHWQVVRLNVVGEGFAYEFFQRMIRLVDHMGMNDGPYWNGHRADRHHMRLGLNLITPVTEESVVGAEYRSMVDQTSEWFGEMFESWRAKVAA